MNAIKEYDYKGLTIKIYTDEDANSPRENDNLGTMVCWHSRYNLGDEHRREGSAEDWVKELLPAEGVERIEAKYEKQYKALVERTGYGAAYLTASKEINVAEQRALWEAFGEIAVFLPLYLYDHSGLTISTGPFSCPWDSGQVGWIYVTRETMLKEFSRKRWTKALQKQAEEILKDEVTAYDHFLRGDVYGYQVCDTDDEVLDSHWGFIGDTEYVTTEAESSAKHYAERKAKEAENAAVREVFIGAPAGAD